MGGACGTNGGEENSIQGFGGELEGENHLEDVGVDGEDNLYIFLALDMFIRHICNSNELHFCDNQNICCTVL